MVLTKATMLLPMLVLLAGACRLAGPGPHSPSAQSATESFGSAKLSTTYTYHCPAGFDLMMRAVGTDAIDLFLSDHSRRLHREPTSSGVKFSDGTVSVWHRGWWALVEVGDSRYSCWETRSPATRPDGPDPGVQFRAIGVDAEQGEWILEMYKDGISFTDQVYGRAFVPPVSLERIEGASIYVSTSEAHRLQVMIETRECIDRLNGERFAASVEINLDGDGYRGCGYVP